MLIKITITTADDAYVKRLAITLALLLMMKRNDGVLFLRRKR
ncbi:MAG: hypothetical protein AAGU27_13190 [Dehalobacterium sp.]